MNIEPNAGDQAPESRLIDLAGRHLMLSSFWQERPLVLVFLRYFGCPFCQAQVVGLREDKSRFLEAGATVVLVGQGTIEDGVAFTDAKRLPFPCLLDPDRGTYRKFGLTQGTPMQVFGPRVALPFLRTGFKVETRQRGLKGGSFMQMPGTFVVDTEGIVRFAHRNKTVADSPRNELILDVLAGLRAQATEPSVPRSERQVVR